MICFHSWRIDTRRILIFKTSLACFLQRPLCFVSGDMVDSTQVVLFKPDHSITLFLRFSNYFKFILIVSICSSLEGSGSTTVVSDQGAWKVLYRNLVRDPLFKTILVFSIRGELVRLWICRFVHYMMLILFSTFCLDNISDDDNSIHRPSSVYCRASSSFHNWYNVSASPVSVLFASYLLFYYYALKLTSWGRQDHEVMSKW